MKVDVCPNCDSSDVEAGTTNGEWFWVRCEACGLDGPTHPTEEEAIVAWNRMAGWKKLLVAVHNRTLRVLLSRPGMRETDRIELLCASNEIRIALGQLDPKDALGGHRWPARYLDAGEPVGSGSPKGIDDESSPSSP